MCTSPTVIWPWAVPSAQAIVARVESARASWLVVKTPLAEAGSTHVPSVVASHERAAVQATLAGACPTTTCGSQRLGQHGGLRGMGSDITLLAA
jgi:hypothetical protein